jgi:CRISPR-associated protein Cmr4
MINKVHIYLLSPLHTGGTTQEGNLVGIARESHTELPYIPSSTIRGKLRAMMKSKEEKFQLFGPDLEGRNTLEQGNIWIGDGSILFLPVPSLSHGVVWVSCPLLLQRWARLENKSTTTIPPEYSSTMTGAKIYLKDAIIPSNELKKWENFQAFLPKDPAANDSLKNLLILPDKHCQTLFQMSLWRQVKIKLDENKSVDGGFRYEEAIPSDTLMYFTWGVTSASNANDSQTIFQELLNTNNIFQIGGQESLGRGFVQQISNN